MSGKWITHYVKDSSLERPKTVNRKKIMPTNLENVIEDIRAGLQEEARENLVRNGSVRTGFLKRHTDVIVRGGDDFVVTFPDYGVFVDQGTQFQKAEPFYSDLVQDGDIQGTYEDEIDEMLEEAFNQDVQQVDDDFNNAINE